MSRLHYVKTPLNLAQLHDELLAASAIPQAALVEGKPMTGDIWLTFPEDPAYPEVAIANIVAAHVPIPPPPAPNYGTDDTPRSQLADAVTNLRAYLGVSSPTAAQSTAALKLLIRVVLYALKRQGF